MNRDSIKYYRCPHTLQQLTIIIEKEEGDEILEGAFKNSAGECFGINEGIPDFITDLDLVGEAKVARAVYSEQSKTYDENVNITFQLYNEEELTIRNYMIDLLNLQTDSKVLEVSSGTGIDSELILNRLSAKGKLFCLDISPEMVYKSKNRLKKYSSKLDLNIGTACSLPFNNDVFDALYCFTGIGHFPDLKKALDEMARVVKPGGKVVFCEKNVPPWLKNTSYGKILMNHNPMFAYDNPLQYIPVEARNVGIRWILGNVHYVVDYEVGVGEPKGNFDLEIPGVRGGTFNTRYYGKLEGVTLETKDLALKASKKTGKSMHKWLDDVIKTASLRILNEKDK